MNIFTIVIPDWVIQKGWVINNYNFMFKYKLYEKSNNFRSDWEYIRNIIYEYSSIAKCKISGKK